MGAIVFGVMIWGIYKLFSLIIRGIKAILTKTLHIPKSKRYAVAYVKKLEVYMELTRSALSVYDQSRHNHDIAVYTLENLRMIMDGIHPDLAYHTELEQYVGSTTLRAMEEELRKVKMERR